MFTFYGLKEGVKAERFLITIPGTKTTAKAVLFEGVPYFHAGKILAAVAKPTTSVFSNVYVALKKLIDNSKHSTGTLIVTRGGLFADTTALRCITPTFFLDAKNTCEYSYVRSMISKVGGKRGHLPDIRTVRNHELYAQLLSLPNAEPIMANAAKQITAEAIEEISGYTTANGRVKFLYCDETGDERSNIEEYPTVGDLCATDTGAELESGVVDDHCLSKEAELSSVEKDKAEERVTSSELKEPSIGVGELTLADLLRLAKQLLTTREVSITFSVK